MKILLALSNYSNLTGSEIYTYELARVLRSKGHQVSIMATTSGGEIAKKTEALGIEIKSFFEEVINGFASTPDIIHAAQPAPTTYCLRYYPNVPLVSTIHSQLIYERPIHDDRIQKYICIRPEIQESVIHSGIPRGKTTLIYNGVDTKRFNTKKTEDRNAILFVGTFDYLRTQTIQDLIGRALKVKKELWLVTNVSDELKAKFPEHVKFLSPTWDVESYNKLCSETASVYLGRTTIEGWMCGKPGWIYDVDEKGIIKDIQFSQVPDDLHNFDIDVMTQKVLQIYSDILRK